jgi:HSP20 family molecular chaperone IbpA
VTDRPPCPVALLHQGEHLLVLIAAPGLQPSEIQVHLIGDRQLQINGQRPYRHPVPQGALQLNELTPGPFQRTLSLPLPVQGLAESPVLQDGLMRLRLRIAGQPIPLRLEGPGPALV